ncbi:unnamed protein product [Didymodactylos carnosus]|uniref:Protein quiver n=1 Tax=Didymodactylos carnosus TaxID=1234261 RepID=A0A814ANI4_9BILA|nr:unnamed protein product [Didymodactylos carnosus]CAF0949323.1 unnamed protein product [Didymodactylos carnosus]CAF3695605.1 unnamed protein product [Didymodactylos carnosus]CAF3723731.1 unnamed protein product [Didymodactylos carnosus]
MNFMSSSSLKIYLSFLFNIRSVLISFAKETCTISKFLCYQCDSRTDDYCRDPFDMRRANRTLECADYCVKFLHYDNMTNNGVFIRRGCVNDYLLYRLSKIDVCYKHTTSSTFAQGRFCMCAKEMCNIGISHNQSKLLLIIILKFLHHCYQRIFSYCNDDYIQQFHIF